MSRLPPLIHPVDGPIPTMEWSPFHDDRRYYHVETLRIIERCATLRVRLTLRRNANGQDFFLRRVERIFAWALESLRPALRQDLLWSAETEAAAHRSMLDFGDPLMKNGPPLMKGNYNVKEDHHG